MAEQWDLLRISLTTRERLERVRESMLRADDAGQKTLDRDNRDRVSMDQVVNLLIDAREKHAERRRRALAKRRGRKTPLPEDVSDESSYYWQQLLAAAPDPEKVVVE